MSLAAGQARWADEADRVRDRLSLEVITETNEMVALRSEWTAACLSAPQPNVFLTWEWTTTWWRHFGVSGRRTPHVVVVRDTDGIVAIAPMQRRRIGGLVGPVVLERMSPEAGDYGGFIVVRRTDEVADALAGHFVEQLDSGQVATVLVSRIGTDDPFIEPWRRAIRERPGLAVVERELEGICLRADIREDFNFGRLTKKHKVRQRLRRLGEAHEQVEFVYRTKADLEQGLDELTTVHRLRWEGREDDLRGLFAAAEQEAFLLDAIRALDDSGWVRLLVLLADDAPVAVELDLAIENRLVMFKGAFDPAFREFSPGQLLHHRLVQDGMEAGIDVFDFGRGDQPYKQRWANGSQTLATFELAKASTVGQLRSQQVRAARALDVRLRPRRPAK